MVNPLDKRLPCLAVLAHATCNRFDAPWVDRQWQRTKALAQQYISPHLGELVGRGSDGDERRFKLQARDMRVPLSVSGRYGLAAPGFTHTALRLSSGAIECAHSQDPLHNLGKLYCNIDVASRTVQWGRHTVTHGDIRRVSNIFAPSMLLTLPA